MNWTFVPKEEEFTRMDLGGVRKHGIKRKGSVMRLPNYSLCILNSKKFTKQSSNIKIRVKITMTRRT